MDKTRDIEILEDFVNRASEFDKRAKYLDSLECLQKADVLCRKWNLWERWVDINSTMGWMYQNLGKYEQAVQHLEEVLEVAKIELEEDHFHLTRLLNLLGISYRSIGQYAKAIAYAKDGLRIGRKHTDKDPLLIGSNLNGLGFTYSQLGDYQRGLKYYEETLLLYRKHLGEDDLSVASILNNLGVHHKSKEDNKQAIYHYEEALKIRRKALGDNHPGIAQSLFNLGICFRDKGDNERGRSYFHRAMHIWEEHLGKEHPHIASALNELAICHRQENKITQAIYFHEKALEIRMNHYGRKHLKVSESLNNIANCYQSSTDFEQAIDCHQQSLEIRQECLGHTHPLVAVSFTNLGNCQYKKKSYESALQCHQRALEIRRERLTDGHSYLAVSLTQMGLCHRGMGRYSAAYEDFQQALILLSPDFDTDDIAQNPVIDSYKDGVLLLEILRNKALTFWYQYKHDFQNLEYLQMGLSAISTAIELIAHMKRSYKGDGSKLTLAEKSSEIYNQAIEMAIELSKQPNSPKHTVTEIQSLAFRFTEQCKAILLLSKFKEQEARAIANIPIELIDKERQLKIELNHLDKCIVHQRTMTESNSDNTGDFAQALLQNSQNQHFEYKQAYDALIEQFEKDYPAYFQLKYDNEKVPVSDIQAYLQKERTPTALVSYFVATDKIYIFTISDLDFGVEEVPKPASFNDWIEELQDAIQLMDLEDFVTISGQLYTCLIAPIESFIGGKEKLIILRHDVLEYLPLKYC